MSKQVATVSSDQLIGRLSQRMFEAALAWPGLDLGDELAAAMEAILAIPDKILIDELAAAIVRCTTR